MSKEIFKIDKQARNDSLTNTKISSNNRKSSYKTEIERNSLHDKIVDCCIGCNVCVESSKTSRSFSKDGLKPKNLIRENKVFIFLGGPACGKSTYADIIADEFGAYLLDSDIIKRKIPEFYSSETGASLVHDESKDIYAKILKKIKKAGFNIATPIIGKDYSSVEDNILAYQESGYDVTLILTWVNKTSATRRALFRFLENGRYVPLTYILDICGHESLANFYRLCCNYPSLKALAIDNEGKPGIVQFNRNCDDVIEILKSKKKIIESQL